MKGTLFIGNSQITFIDKLGQAHLLPNG